jgi:hypothetical protein
LLYIKTNVIMPRKKNPDNNYFNQAVEDAVCIYLNSDKQRERETAFRIIYPALQKIAEVWFNKLKVSYMDTDSIDMQMDCVAHIVEKMHMFNCGTGTKSFSYFTVMAKFYYMIHNNRNYTHVKRYIPISYMSIEFDKPNTDVRDEKAKEAKLLLEAFTLYLELNLEQILPKEKYRPVGTYLIDLLNNFEKVEDINRRKIVNQMSLVDGMPSRHHITKIMNYLTSQFNLFKKQWMDGNTSLNFIEKTALTKEEKMIVKENFKSTSVKFGITRMAKQFGVSEPVLREYISTII